MRMKLSQPEIENALKTISTIRGGEKKFPEGVPRCEHKQTGDIKNN